MLLTSAGHNYLSVPASIILLQQSIRRCSECEKEARLRRCTLPESEAGPESREVTAARLAARRLAQPEESVTFHGTLPQVFATPGAGQLEHKRVLLLPTLRSQEITICC